MSQAACKVIICKPPAIAAASGSPVTLAALQACGLAAENAKDIGASEASLFALAQAMDKAGEILRDADDKAAKAIGIALADVLP